MATKRITVLGRIEAKPGTEETLKQALLSVLGPTRAEAGCINFYLHQGVENRRLFMAYQNWASKEDEDKHYQAPYMQAYMKEAPNLLGGTPDVTVWENIEPETKEETKMDAKRKTLIGVLDEIAGRSFPSANCEVPMAAYGDKEGREEVIIRYTVGKGEFNVGGRKPISALHCAMFKMNGERDGTFEGVWEPQIPPEKMSEKPAQPVKPFDKPEGPFPETYIGAITKAIWTFGDDSAIIGIGPASLQLVEFTDESQIFLVAVGGIIANGTGKYKDARGVKTALGATFIPKGVDMFHLKPGDQFDAITVETFRVIRARYIKK